MKIIGIDPLISGAMRDIEASNSDLIRSFTVEELVLATKKFSNCCLIGTGGFAKVSWFLVTLAQPHMLIIHQVCINSSQLLVRFTAALSPA